MKTLKNKYVTTFIILLLFIHLIIYLLKIKMTYLEGLLLPLVIYSNIAIWELSNKVDKLMYTKECDSNSLLPQKKGIIYFVVMFSLIILALIFISILDKMY